MNTDSIDVVILCGGEGKRLRSVVKDRPKVLAEINGRAFLDILIDYVAGFGFRRFILCIGYMGEVIKRHYQNRQSGKLEFIFSEERQLLGTAGGLKNAESFITSDPFLAMNGDVFCPLELNKFVDFHVSKKASYSLCVLKAAAGKDYGVVKLDDSQRVSAFIEKAKAGPGDFVSAGIYLFRQGIFSKIPANQDLSLEYDVFPKIKQGFFGYPINSELVDIGTPEKYKKAKLTLGGYDKGYFS